MNAADLTVKQRQAIECMEGARAEGVGLSAYARERGISVREIYDSLVLLRKKGFLPPAERKQKNPFVAVRVVKPSVLPVRNAMVCRIMAASGITVECAEWPPAAWLLALQSGRTDAAA
jgi:hypothetical protein